MPPAEASKKPTTPSGVQPRAVNQFVYPGVKEAERPGLVADLWRAGALSVNVVKNPDGTYTVTAILPA
ncbi:MAG: hypothetical protein PSX79_14920 [bacterium]|nr:hypothetical protein [bacterium]